MKPIKKPCKDCPYLKTNVDDNFYTLGLNYDNILDFFDGNSLHSCHKIGFSLDNDKDSNIGCKGSVLFQQKIKGLKNNSIKSFDEMIIEN